LRNNHDIHDADEDRACQKSVALGAVLAGGPRRQLDLWAAELSAGRLFWTGLTGAGRAEVEPALIDYDC